MHVGLDAGVYEILLDGDGGRREGGDECVLIG